MVSSRERLNIGLIISKGLSEVSKYAKSGIVRLNRRVMDRVADTMLSSC